MEQFSMDAKSILAMSGEFKEVSPGVYESKQEIDKYPNLDSFFGMIHKAHEELQKMLPETCEICGKTIDECECQFY